MSATIAIHPDDYTESSTPELSDASSPRWAAALEAEGFKVRWVDVYRPDLLHQLADCQGFMWRWAHFNGMYRVARTVLPVIEGSLGLTVYPDQATCWHYDDKAAQAYLLQAHNIPVPPTWIFFDEAAAMEWAQTADLPVVAKFAIGAGSTNVCLLRDRRSIVHLVRQVFSKWHGTLPANGTLVRIRERIRDVARLALFGRNKLDISSSEPQKACLCFQLFLDKNAFDTRVAVIGNRAFAFRRMNRVNDFRASGSGLIDYEPSRIDERFIRMAFTTSSSLKMQSCAIDGLYAANLTPVVGEVSYTYASWAVRNCPGHWELDGHPASGKLHWRSGHLWPEEAQIADYIRRLRNREIQHSDLLNR